VCPVTGYFDRFNSCRRGRSIRILKVRGLKPGDLLPGVVAVRGYLPYDPSNVEDWERRLPRAPDAKSLAVCAAD